MTPKDLSDPQHVAAVHGLRRPGRGLRHDTAGPARFRACPSCATAWPKMRRQYGSLQELMDDISEDPERLGDFGVNNPAILADSCTA